VWRAVQNQAIKKTVQAGHKTNHNDEHANSEGDAQSGYARLFNSRKKVSSGYIKYDTIIRH